MNVMKPAIMQEQARDPEVVHARAGVVEPEAVRQVVDEQPAREAEPRREEPGRGEHRARVREAREPALASSRPSSRRRSAPGCPCRRTAGRASRSVSPSSIQCSENVTGPRVTGPNESGSVSAAPSAARSEPGAIEEEVGAVDEHRAQVDPGGRPRGKPARALVVAEAPVAILQEADRAPPRSAASCGPT